MLSRAVGWPGPQLVRKFGPANCRTSARLRLSTLTCSAVSKRRSYYEILGVEQTAAPEEIRAAYRSLAKAFHPDISQEEDSHEVFAEINSAYAVLSDPEERGRYDYLWRYEQARRDAEAAGGDPDRPLSPEEAERAAALDKLEDAHREAERARRLAKEARRAAERAKRQARDAKRQAAEAAARASAAAVGTGAAAANLGPAAASAQKQPAGSASAAAGGAGRRAEQVQGPAAEREARRAAREATQAAKRQAREARRHASQVRYWAQWAEHEVKTVRQAAGLEPAPSSPEELLLWEWQQLQARQRQQQEQEQRQQQKGARGRRTQGGAGRGQGAGSGAWEPPAPPPE